MMLTHRAATLLGEIPHDWNRDLLKTFLSNDQGGDWGANEGEVPIRVLRSTNFTDKGTLDFGDVAVRHFTASKAETMALKVGDLLLERSGGGLNQPVGRVGFIETDLVGHWFSNFVHLLRPDPEKIAPEYLGWVLLELNRCGVVERLQHQTTQMRNLDYRYYLRVYLPRPSPAEQKLVARILKTANETVEALGKKLHEAVRVKTALMQQLFIGGIPRANTKTKPAKALRFEFQVPEEWDVSPLGKSLSLVEYGSNAPSNDERRGLPIVAIPEVIASRFQLGTCSYAEVRDSEAKALRLEPDDVLLIRTNGNAEYIGKSTVIGEEAVEHHIIFASYLIRLKTRKDILSGRYLNYFLASSLGRRQCLAMANTSAGNHNLGARAIRQFCFPRPCPALQETIVHLGFVGKRSATHEA